MAERDLTEENANLVKWCVHVLGPDDVIAAKTHADAVAHADALNKAILRAHAEHPDDPVLTFAYAAPWPWNTEAHAEALAKEPADG